MIKNNNENQMSPERGEGCRCKGETPKTFSSSRQRYKLNLII